jgi:hypothetical protein
MNNERINKLAEQAGAQFISHIFTSNGNGPGVLLDDLDLEKFAELLKQAIYDRVKEELIDDADIAATTDPLAREYLKGCNGGTVDALCHIQNFGVDIDE